MEFDIKTNVPAHKEQGRLSETFFRGVIMGIKITCKPTEIDVSFDVSDVNSGPSVPKTPAPQGFTCPDSSWWGTAVHP